MSCSAIVVIRSRDVSDCGVLLLLVRSILDVGPNAQVDFNECMDDINSYMSDTSL